MDFKPQKALHRHLELAKKTTTVDNDQYMVSEKLDGWYGSKRIGGSIQALSGRVIPSLSGFSSMLNDAELSCGWDTPGRVIFEILVKGSPLFKDLNGILNRSKDECEAVNAYIKVHDFIPDDKPLMDPEGRYSIVNDYVDEIDYSRVQIAHIIAIGDHNEIKRQAELIWLRRDPTVSNEGAIGKRIGSTYAPGKRNKDILKVKSEITIEMKVIGTKEGKGKYKGTLGAMIVEDIHGVTHEVSGMTDTERDEWWNGDNSELYKHPVEIAAMQVLPNGALREGRFKAIRFDKLLEDLG